MRRVIPLLALSLALATACTPAPAPDAEPLIGPTWQVTGVFTDPATPGGVTSDAELIFGRATLTGTTGCARFNARAHYDTDADTIEVTRLTMDEPDPQCAGVARHVHDQLAGILEGTFDVSHPSDTEVVLTKAGDGPDRPAIHAVST